MSMQSRATTRRRISTTVVVAAMIGAFFAGLYHPAVYQWGATLEERAAPMAGDDFVSNPSMVATRAITIERPPEQVWPWLVQIGVDRGGFYTYDWAERLFADPVHNANAIVPAWQTLDVGDLVHPFPPERGLPSWRVRQVVPARVLVVAQDDGSWSWATKLQPLEDGQTRLVTRMRGQRTALSVVLDPADLIVFPRVLVGVKQRAEGTLPGMPGTLTGEPLPTARLPVHWWAAAVWLAGTVALGRSLGAGRWRLRRRHPGVTIGVAFVAGAGYLIMSDTPPGGFLASRPSIGLLAGVAGAGLGWWLLRRDPAHAATPVRRMGRAVVAAAEAGLLLVLPVAAVWQAAVALGWTEHWPGRLLWGGLAVAGAGTVVAAVTGDWRGTRRHRLAAPLVLATGFAITGAGLIPLAGAAVLELLPLPRPGLDHDSSRRPRPPERERSARLAHR
jgi:hypothetical protein